MKKLLVMMSISLLGVVVLTGCNKKVADTVDGTVDSLSDTVANVGDTVVEIKEEIVEADVDQEVVEVVDEAIIEEMEEEVKDAVVDDGYQVFDPVLLAKALEEDKQVVLFFHADRCPSCIALDESINEDPDQIPVNTVVFKMDYDQETDLKRLYKVRQQHTLVYLDDEGNATDVTTAIATVEQLVEKL